MPLKCTTDILTQRLDFVKGFNVYLDNKYLIKNKHCINSYGCEHEYYVYISSELFLCMNELFKKYNIHMNINQIVLEGENGCILFSKINDEVYYFIVADEKVGDLLFHSIYTLNKTIGIKPFLEEYIQNSEIGILPTSNLFCEKLDNKRYLFNKDIGFNKIKEDYQKDFGSTIEHIDNLTFGETDGIECVGMQGILNIINSVNQKNNIGKIKEIIVIDNYIKNDYVLFSFNENNINFVKSNNEYLGKLLLYSRNYFESSSYVTKDFINQIYNNSIKFFRNLNDPICCMPVYFKDKLEIDNASILNGNVDIKEIADISSTPLEIADEIAQENSFGKVYQVIVEGEDVAVGISHITDDISIFVAAKENQLIIKATIDKYLKSLDYKDFNRIKKSSNKKITVCLLADAEIISNQEPFFVRNIRVNRYSDNINMAENLAISLYKFHKKSLTLLKFGLNLSTNLERCTIVLEDMILSTLVISDTKHHIEKLIVLCVEGKDAFHHIHELTNKIIDSYKKNKKENSVFLNIEHILIDRSTNMEDQSINITNSSDIKNIAQAKNSNIEQINHNKESNGKIDELEKLVKQLIELVPEEEKEKLSRDFSSFLDEIKSKKPRKEWYELSSKGLVEAAKTVNKLAVPIAKTIETIIKTL